MLLTEVHTAYTEQVTDSRVTATWIKQLQQSNVGIEIRYKENWSQRKLALSEKCTLKTRPVAKRTWKIRPKIF